MPERENNMLKNIHEDKSTKLPFVIFESLREKMMHFITIITIEVKTA